MHEAEALLDQGEKDGKKSVRWRGWKNVSELIKKKQKEKKHQTPKRTPNARSKSSNKFEGQQQENKLSKMTQADAFSPVTDYRAKTEVVDVPHGDFATAPYVDNNGSSELIYKTKPRYDTVFVVMLVMIPIVLFGIGIGLFFVTWYASALLFAQSLLLVVLFSLVFPRHIEVYSDRLVIRANGYSMSTKLSDITEVSEIEQVGTVRGCKFNTSFSGRVIIRRRDAQDIIFCPMHPSEFVSFVKYAACPSMFSRPTPQYESWTASPLMV